MVGRISVNCLPETCQNLILERKNTEKLWFKKKYQSPKKNKNAMNIKIQRQKFCKKSSMESTPNFENEVDFWIKRWNVDAIYLNRKWCSIEMKVIFKRFEESNITKGLQRAISKSLWYTAFIDFFIKLDLVGNLELNC